ncbi:MAG TPA: hypothetical protein VHB98_06035 [Chloroflexota bacterium]|nr:hypothetical protein [Chloroflexota bacterium]
MNNSNGARLAWGQQTPVRRSGPLPRYLGLPLVAWLTMLVVLAVIGGGIYTVWLARTSPQGPTLPAAPPHAASLGRSSTADMLDGNFITTTALYRSAEPPAKVIAFYKAKLAGYAPQFGAFQKLAFSTAPSNTPAAALQYMPPIFNSPTASDPHAARYVYTEYSRGDSDTSVAIDMRHSDGPTLVYMEMLTQPSS